MTAGALDVTHGGFLDPNVRLYDGAGRLVAVLTREAFRARPRARWRECPRHGRYAPLVEQFGTVRRGDCARCKAERGRPA